jgi:hypothetical protein
LKKDAKTFAWCFAGCAGGVLALSGCAQDTQQCLLPGQQKLIQVEMFFGRDVEGHGEVTNKQWSNFLASDVAPRFPDGFTVFDASGEWLNPATHFASDEASKVLLILARPSDSVAADVAAIADSYKRKFRQQAVGVVTSESCAAF